MKQILFIGFVLSLLVLSGCHEEELPLIITATLPPTASVIEPSNISFIEGDYCGHDFCSYNGTDMWCRDNETTKICRFQIEEV